MKLPENIDNVTISQSHDYSIFPPIGFIEIEEANDGAGDNYGLYWELGKESEEPVIFSKRHEEYLLIPEFLNLDSFLNWYEETQGQESPVLNLKDTSFFINLYNRAKVLTKTGKIEEAIIALEKSTELFGEYSDSWALLAENYYKVNELEKADSAALISIISNYVFGFPSKKAIEHFYKIDTSGKLKNNPLVKRRDGLLSGGDFTNPFRVNYDKLLEAISEFRELKDYKSALILEQNYGYLMCLEKNDIKAKYNFNDDEWSEYFKNEILYFYPERK